MHVGRGDVDVRESRRAENAVSTSGGVVVGS